MCGLLNAAAGLPIVAVANVERKEPAMSMRITANAGWSTHTAWVHLRKDWQQLSADVAAGADARVIAADKAAIVESRTQVVHGQGGHLVDVTV
jgi:hypothetical protein